MKDREARVVVDKKGRITIPAAFLKHLGISDGDPLAFRIEDDELRVAPTTGRIGRAHSGGSTRRGQATR